MVDEIYAQQPNGSDADVFNGVEASASQDEASGRTLSETLPAPGAAAACTPALGRSEGLFYTDRTNRTGFPRNGSQPSPLRSRDCTAETGNTSFEDLANQSATPAEGDPKRSRLVGGFLVSESSTPVSPSFRQTERPAARRTKIYDDESDEDESLASPPPRRNGQTSSPVPTSTAPSSQSSSGLAPGSPANKTYSPISPTGSSHNGQFFTSTVSSYNGKSFTGTRTVFGDDNAADVTSHAPTREVPTRKRKMSAAPADPLNETEGASGTTMSPSKKQKRDAAGITALEEVSGNACRSDPSSNSTSNLGSSILAPPKVNTTVNDESIANAESSDVSMTDAASESARSQFLRQKLAERSTTRKKLKFLKSQNEQQELNASWKETLKALKKTRKAERTVEAAEAALAVERAQASSSVRAGSGAGLPAPAPNAVRSTSPDTALPARSSPQRAPLSPQHELFRSRSASSSPGYGREEQSRSPSRYHGSRRHGGGSHGKPKRLSSVQIQYLTDMRHLPKCPATEMAVAAVLKLR